MIRSPKRCHTTAVICPDTYQSRFIMMNKKIFSLLALAGLALYATSCADPELGPVVTFDTAGKGAYVRLVEEKTDKLINLLDLAASRYIYSVEFVDLEKGALVSEYRLDLTYIDNNPSNGSNGTGPVELRSYSASEFITTAGGFKGLTDITITPEDVFRAAGVDASSVKAGDQFRVDGVLTLQDGSTFAYTNSSAAVNGSAFKGHFRFVLPAGCPSDLAGTYSYVGSDFWCNGGTGTGSVNIISKGGGAYSFSDWSFGSYVSCYGGTNSNWGTLQFNDVCKEVAFTGRVDAFGDTWTFTHSFSGEEWTIEWVNTYGEAGKAVITKTGGWGLTAK